jgi:NADH dehydrogenase FAD-containing subunit
VQKLDDAIAALEAKPESERVGMRVVIVGGGYGGVELAASLRLRPGEVLLVHSGDSVLPQSDPAVREKALGALARAGTAVRYRTKVAAVGPDTITIESAGSSEVLRADLVVWTAGVRVNAVVGNKGIAGARTDGRGRLCVDSTLAVEMEGDSSRVCYALGDNAGCAGHDLPSSAQVAARRPTCACVPWVQRTRTLTREAPFPFHIRLSPPPLPRPPTRLPAHPPARPPACVAGGVPAK